LTLFGGGEPQPITFACVKLGGRDESSVYGRELTQQRYDASGRRAAGTGALRTCGAPLTDLLAGVSNATNTPGCDQRLIRWSKA
jgi:hypothetical protein